MTAGLRADPRGARLVGALDLALAPGLGQQLALLLDGASTRTRTLGIEATPTAANIAAALIEHATPQPERRDPEPARG